MNGQRLRQKRKEAGLSGEAVAQALNTTKVTISRWENGTSEPNDTKKATLAKILNTSVAYLMGETDNPASTYKFEVIEPPPQEEKKQVNYAYWGNVVDEVDNLLARGDESEISSITPLIKLAYEKLTQHQKPVETFMAQMPILGGNHNKNTQNVHIATN